MKMKKGERRKRSKTRKVDDEEREGEKNNEGGKGNGKSKKKQENKKRMEREWKDGNDKGLAKKEGRNPEKQGESWKQARQKVYRSKYLVPSNPVSRREGRSANKGGPGRGGSGGKMEGGMSWHCEGGGTSKKGGMSRVDWTGRSRLRKERIGGKAAGKSKRRGQLAPALLDTASILRHTQSPRRTLLSHGITGRHGHTFCMHGAHRRQHEDHKPPHTTT